MGGLGLVIGVALAVASKVFYVYVDPKIVAVDDVLPGANCGGCGFPGCTANAEAIVAGTASPTSCVAGGPELGEQIAALLGISVSAREPDFAIPGCYYGTDKADTKFEYAGVSDCRAAALLHGGMKVCRIGCLGLGTCVTACPFDALSMGPEGLPVVDFEKCTGCGTCERVCPKHIINLSSVTRRMLKEYTDEECTTPCQRACPAGINIREYVRLAAEGDYDGSVRVIKERNPFPAVIGRICPHPCEFECRRNLVDESVAINYIKRFCGDLEYSRGKRVQPYKAPSTGRTMAVVGGGIEGLTAAFFLARLGHSPTLFEATDRLGGLLRTAIPEDRLSRDVLDWEIEGVREMGVEMKTGTALGRDVTAPGLLREGFEAVFIASGGWDARLERKVGPEPPEQQLPGCHLLVDFVKAEKTDSELPGDKVLFVGGGKTALQAAMGHANSTVLLRQPEEDARLAGVPEDAVEEAKKSGVVVLFGKAATLLEGEDEELRRVEYIDTATGESDAVDTNTVVFASGRIPELVVIRRPEPVHEGEEPAEATPPPVGGPVRWMARPPYKKPADGPKQGLLAPVDPVTDWSAAVEAIGAGRRGAASVHLIAYGEQPELPANVVTPTVYVQDVDAVEEVKPLPREIMPLKAPGEEDRRAPEIEQGYTEEMCKREAARCLQCGLICYLHTEVPKSKSEGDEAA